MQARVCHTPPFYPARHDGRKPLPPFYFWFTFGLLLVYFWFTFGLLLVYFWPTRPQNQANAETGTATAGVTETAPVTATGSSRSSMNA
jgi:hypothetical protein